MQININKIKYFKFIQGSIFHISNDIFNPDFLWTCAIIISSCFLHKQHFACEWTLKRIVPLTLMVVGNMILNSSLPGGYMVYGLLYLIFFLKQGILKFWKLCKHIKNEKKLSSTISRYFVFEQMINVIAVLISLIYGYISIFLIMSKITFIIDDTDRLLR